MLISQAGDLLISGSGRFISLGLGVGNECGGNVFEGVGRVGAESVYLGMEIQTSPNEFIDDENISDGVPTFPGATLSANNNYEGGVGIFLFCRV